jgi:hypothetical protein
MVCVVTCEQRRAAPGQKNANKELMIAWSALPGAPTRTAELRDPLHCSLELAPPLSALYPAGFPAVLQ